MIPYTILSGEILWKNHSSTPIRILELSAKSFTFRLAHRHSDAQKDIQKEIIAIRLSFFIFQDARHTDCTLQEFHISLIEENTFWRTYEAITTSIPYQKLASILSKEYTNYIRLKLYEDDARLSHELCDYPEEEIFFTDFSEWKDHFYEILRDNFYKNQSSDSNLIWNKILSDSIQIALELDGTEQITDFINHQPETFRDHYYEKKKFNWHPISAQPISCIYLGNQYCRFRFPDIQLLIQCLDHAIRNHIHPVLCFPPVRQKDEPWFQKILTLINQKLSSYPLEIVLNDYGSASFIRRTYPHFRITQGILLNKRKKDVRMQYRNGVEELLSFLKENTMNSGFTRNLLQEMFGIQTLSFESCGYLYDIPDGNHILHLPFYQMNTSGHCTRYSYTVFHDRGKGFSVNHCQQFCEKEVFLYPSHLPMIGYMNSLFGLDNQILCVPEYMQALINHHISRIVLNIL